MAHTTGRLTGVVGRPGSGLESAQIWLGDCHVSPNPISTFLSFWYVGLLVHVGRLIHVMPRVALWLVPLPWTEECVSLLMGCVFCLISPTYKYLSTLVEIVSNKLLLLDCCSSFMHLCRIWRPNLVLKSLRHLANLLCAQVLPCASYLGTRQTESLWCALFVPCVFL